MVTSEAASRSGRCAQVLSQVHERQEARDTGEDHGCLEGAGGDEAERHAFVLPLDHRVQGDGCADACEGDDHLEEGAPEHGGAAARADDEVPIGLEVAVEGQRGDRDEGDQVEHARDERGLPQWGHRVASGRVSIGDRHVVSCVGWSNGRVPSRVSPARPVRSLRRRTERPWRLRRGERPEAVIEATGVDNRLPLGARLRGRTTTSAEGLGRNVRPLCAAAALRSANWPRLDCRAGVFTYLPSRGARRGRSHRVPPTRSR